MPSALPVSYTTVSLMMMTLPEIGSVTTLTSAQLAHYAGEAQAEVNGRIARYYALPFTREIPLLQTITTRVAIYNLLALRLFTAERLTQSPWPDRYKEAMITLASVANGSIPLVDSSGTIVEARSDIAEVYSTTKDYVPTMWEGHPGDMIQDPDKIEDEANRRDITIRNRLL